MWRVGAGGVRRGWLEARWPSKPFGDPREGERRILSIWAAEDSHLISAS